MIKQIGISDFNHFENHKNFVGDHDIDKIYGRNLAMLKGKEWRVVRTCLTPMFSGSKMRQMFQLVTECAEDYVNHFIGRSKIGQPVHVEMKETFSQFTNDVIATCAFGLKIYSMRDPKNDFFLAGKKMMDLGRACVLIRLILLKKLPTLAKLLKIQLMDKKEEQLFRSIILDTMSMRKENNLNLFRPDMINLLMQVREESVKQQADKSSSQFDELAMDQESETRTKSVSHTWTRGLMTISSRIV